MGSFRDSRMLSMISYQFEFSRLSQMNKKERLCHLAKTSAAKTTLSVGLGVSVGHFIRTQFAPVSSRIVMYIRFLGDLFSNFLNTISIPLIVFSLITGITALDIKISKRIAVVSIIYFNVTTLIAAVTGTILALLIRPGKPVSHMELIHSSDEGPPTFTEPILDLIRQIFPENIILAIHQSAFTKLVPSLRNLTTNGTGDQVGNENSYVEYVPKISYKPGPNLLGLVSCSICYGIAIHLLQHQGEPLKDLIRSFSELTLKVVNVLLWLAPVGVFSLVAAQVVSIEDLSILASTHALYLVTALTGMILHGYITLPLLYFLIVRSNPLPYLNGLVEAMITAFGTSSSSATLPVLMKNLKHNKVDANVIAFVAPVGATVNMDGCGVYFTVGVLFICQFRNEQLDIYKLLMICMTSTAAAVGAAGVPGSGLTCMALVFASIGLPPEDIGIIMSLDWLVDRFVTMVNIMGDGWGAGIIEKIVEEKLARSSNMTGERRESIHGLFGKFSVRWDSNMASQLSLQDNHGRRTVSTTV